MVLCAGFEFLNFWCLGLGFRGKCLGLEVFASGLVLAWPSSPVVELHLSEKNSLS